MKKKTFSFVMLSILLAQNFGFAVNAYAVTTTEAQTETTDTAKKEAELSNSTPSLPPCSIRITGESATQVMIGRLPKATASEPVST
ncbi:MAG: hypothetical protein E6911_08375, partial [Enterococcus faecalis]|nr:hypothetical protein [Enterococcus faecalis]